MLVVDFIDFDLNIGQCIWYLGIFDLQSAKNRMQ